jgi:hypothetical protein
MRVEIGEDAFKTLIRAAAAYPQWFFLSYGASYVDEDGAVHFTDRLLYSQHKAMFEAGN